MSEYECLVPELEWNLMRHTRQEQAETGEEDRNRNQNRYRLEDTNTNTHVQQQQQQHCGIRFHQTNHHPFSLPNPMSMKNNQQMEELTWQNGQLAMHGHGGPTVLPTAPLKPIWGSNGTLESIVHQASASTSCLKHTEYHVNGIVPTNNIVSPIGMNKGSSSVDKKPDIVPKSNSSCKKPQNMYPGLKKRGRLESARHATTSNDLLSYGYGNDRDEKNTKKMDRSMCASSSAPFCPEDLDPTMMTWASFESPRSFKKNRLFAEDDSAGGYSENQDEDQENKTETGRSHSSKRGRAAAVHNQSERRRRDRINEKMKTLQRLVPNARKMDKASMLDEVIEYLKQLQAQVHMMNTMRNINNSLPQMAMMPIGMSPQQQLQMSLLSRMQAAGVGVGVGLGMGMGMRMMDMNSMARATAQQQALPQLLHPASASAFASAPQFMVQQPAHPPTSAQASTNPGNNASLHMQGPCFAFLAQKMNIDLYNKMAALYRQQTTTPPSNTNEAKRE